MDRRPGSLPIKALLAILLCFLIGGAANSNLEVYSGHQNGRVSGFEKLALDTFSARPLDSKFYTEVWFNEMQFADEGIIVIVCIQLHNLGFKSGYADTYITVSDSTGLYLSKDSLDPEQIRIDPQGFGVSAGPHRIELAGDKYLIRYKGKSIQAEFTYRIQVPSFQQGDGKVVFKPSGDFVKHTFPIPWAEVEGTVTYNSRTVRLKGQGSMNHDWQKLSPTRYMSEWRAFWLYGEDATVSIVRCSAPDLAGKWVQRLMVAEKGKILFSSHDYQFRESAPLRVEESGGACPTIFQVEAVHGDEWLRGEIKLTRIREKKNILADYPFLFRELAKALTDETWSYRFWAEFKFEFHGDGRTRIIRGAGTGNVVDSIKKKEGP